MSTVANNTAFAPAAPHMKLAYRLIGPRLYIRYRAWRAMRQARDGHEGELKLLAFIVPRGRMAIDVGANRGNYSFYLSRLAPRTVAYEVSPVMARFLKEARLPGVEVREVGLSDRKGRLTYCARRNAKGRPMYNSAFLSDETPDGDFAILQPVNVVRLDNEGHDDVGFIKIDVEGHEYQVIEGARELLARCRPTLLVEILEGRGDREAVARNATVRLLNSLGYEAYIFARGALQPLCDAPLGPDTMNYIFLPRNAAVRENAR